MEKAVAPGLLCQTAEPFRAGGHLIYRDMAPTSKKMVDGGQDMKDHTRIIRLDTALAALRPACQDL
jgi:hypothetical protein